MTDVSHLYNNRITVGGRLIVVTLFLLVVSALLQWLVLLLAIAWYLGKIGA
jgi:hypothetical protein